MPLAEISDHALYYELHDAIEPDSKCPPLLLVMGLGGRCAGWLPLQVPTLRERRRVLIYDHRGVGESGDPDKPFTTDDLARDLLELLEVLGESYRSDADLQAEWEARRVAGTLPVMPGAAQVVPR